MILPLRSQGNDFTIKNFGNDFTIKKDLKRILLFKNG